jgi:TPP-dependent pyruvate/acetoin dehydrogenase alpha subunit
VIGQAEFDQLDKKCKDTITQAAETALTFAEPDPQNMEEEVYAP